MAERIGVVGLGAMGLPMARTLAAAGRPVVGFDVSTVRRAAVADSADGLAALCDRVDVVVLSLPSSREVEAVVAGDDGLLSASGSVGLIIDTSTADPGSTRMLHQRAAAAGIGYVDAPVSGGAKGAADGRLLVMVGGADADLDRAVPILDDMARAVVQCGGPGTGNVVKLVNNLLCAAHLALAGEALRLGEAAGVAPETLVAALNQGSGRSAVTEVNLPTWVMSGAYDSGFTMGLMRKDVALAEALAEDEAASCGGLGPLSQRAAEIWAESIRTLGDSEDFNRMVDLTRKGAV